jgi:hypothetical protein
MAARRFRGVLRWLRAPRPGSRPATGRCNACLGEARRPARRGDRAPPGPRGARRLGTAHTAFGSEGGRRPGTSRRALGGERHPDQPVGPGQGRGAACPSRPGGLFATCVDCGGPLTRPRHVRCEACWSKTPAQSAEVRRRRGRAIAVVVAGVHDWKAEHPDAARPSAEVFAPIREGLDGVKVADIMAATGLSKTTASQIRSGRVLPHVRHWPAVTELAHGRVLGATEAPAYGMGSVRR